MMMMMMMMLVVKRSKAPEQLLTALEVEIVLSTGIKFVSHDDFNFVLQPLAESEL